MSDLYLVRHGATSFNDPKQERLRGWLDVSLSPNGLRGAQRAAQALKGIQPSAVVSSDLRRASDTGHAIAQATGAPLHLDSRLRPWHMGVLTGHPLAETKHLVNYYLHHPDLQIPGGEAYNTFHARTKAAFLDHASASEKLGKPVVVVTHHSNSLAVKSIFNGGSPISAHDGPPKPGGVVQVSKPPGISRPSVIKEILSGEHETSKVSS